jgi:hypothetical protein
MGFPLLNFAEKSANEIVGHAANEELRPDSLMMILN